MLIPAINEFRVCLSKSFNTQADSAKEQRFFCDVFESSNLVFLGNATSAGTPLKRLHNVPDPFFGTLLINGSQMNKIEKGLETCTTVKKAVNYLKKYKPYMQETELVMFERFEESAPSSPRMRFQDLLKKWYDDALIKLKLEEFAVMDEIDRTSRYLTPESELNIRAKTTKCRTLILNNDPMNTFKRKTLLESLERIAIKKGEEEIFEDIIDKADYLPSSATSENAFIVKYANRSHEEISKRLIRMSELTIDHLLARANGGENNMKNFVPASVKANSLKGCKSLEKFIKRFPQTPEFFQKFIDYMINLINNGGFPGHQAYPYDIRRTVFKESGGMINLDLSGYQYSKKQARKLEKEYMNKNRKSVKV